MRYGTVAALPIAAHLAPGIADEGAVEDENGGANGPEAGDVGVDDIPGGTDGRLQDVLRRVGLRHELVDFTPVSDSA